MYIGQRCLCPLQSRLWVLTQFSQLPSAALWYFPESHQCSGIYSSSKVILVLGKVRSHTEPNLGCRGVELPGWFNVLPKSSAQDVMQKGVAFWIIWMVSVEECSCLMQNLMHIHCSTQSFWMRQPHSTHAHSLASTTPLTSTANSSLFTHAHSSPLSSAAGLCRCRTNSSIILTVSGRFLDRLYRV